MSVTREYAFVRRVRNWSRALAAILLTGFGLFGCFTAKSDTREFVNAGKVSWTGSPEVIYLLDGAVSTGSDYNELVLKFWDVAASNTLTIADSVQVNARLLLVGGGGAGGTCISTSGGAGGGGGAGGFVEATRTIDGGTYSIVVGAGGAAETSLDTTSGASGGDSLFSTVLIAHGGGGGGAMSDGVSGGSGGGGSAFYETERIAQVGGDAIADGDEGNGGGNGNVAGYGGGGGGAGSAGQDAGSTRSKGGAGLESDITGDEVYYAGGGGGGRTRLSAPLTGGNGGGGNGGSTVLVAEAGIDGLGGGGGGGGQVSPGGKGGDGVVIVRITQFAETKVAAPMIDDAVYNGSNQAPFDFGIAYTYVNGVTNATNAGTYSFTVIPGSGLEWMEGGTAAKTIDWTIAPASNVITKLSLAGWPVGGTPNEPTISARWGADSVQYQFGYGATEDAVTVWHDAPAELEVPGSYVVRAVIPATGNWTGAHGVSSFTLWSVTPAPTVQVEGASGQVFSENFQDWLTMSATNEMWTFPMGFTDIRPNHMYGRKAYEPFTSETNGLWEVCNGMWVAKKYASSTNNAGVALQMEGNGNGCIQFTDAESAPRGLESIGFNARLAQVVDFDDFAWYRGGDAGIYSISNYTFMARTAFDLESNKGFDGNASLSMVANYLPSNGCYEARWEWLGNNSNAKRGQRLCLYRWNVTSSGTKEPELIIARTNTAFNVEELTLLENSSTQRFAPLFISVSNDVPNNCTWVAAGIRRCGVTLGTNPIGTSALNTQNGRNANWLGVCFKDTDSRRLAKGSYGVLSANCPGVFARPEFSHTVQIVSPGSGKTKDTFENLSLAQVDNMQDIKNCAEDDLQDQGHLGWNIMPGRMEAIYNSADVNAIVCAPIEQRLQLFLGTAGDIDWSVDPCTNVVLNSFCDSSFIVPLYTSKDCSVKFSVAGTIDDVRTDVVIDSVVMRQWRGGNWDDSDVWPLLPAWADDQHRHRLDGHTNFVFTSAWVTNSSVLLSAKRAKIDEPSSIRSPLMDGFLDDGHGGDGTRRGLGLGTIAFGYANAQPNARIQVQIATNGVAYYVVDGFDRSFNETIWTTVAEFDFSTLSDEARREGTLSHRIGIPAVSSVVRLVVPEDLVTSVVGETNPDRFGEVYITGISVSDYPEAPVPIPAFTIADGVLTAVELNGAAEVTIPDGVTSIGDGVFSGCSGITSVTIPDSVTSIGNGAFAGCTGLTSVSLPDALMGAVENGDPFADCPNDLVIAYRDTSIPPSIIVESDCQTIVANANYTQAAAVLQVYLSKPCENDLSVTVMPQFTDGSEADWSDYFRFSTMSDTIDEPMADGSDAQLPFVRIPANSTGKQTIYVFALRSDAHTLGSAKVKFQSEIVDDPDADAAIQEKGSKSINIAAETTAITSPTEGSPAVFTTCNDEYPFTIAVSDTYADTHATTNGYQIYIKYSSSDAFSKLDGQYCVGDGGVLYKLDLTDPDNPVRTSDLPILKYTVSGLDLVSQVYVVAPVNPNASNARKSEIRTFYADVKDARTASLSYWDETYTEEKRTFNEGESMGIKIKLSEKYEDADRAMYAYLKPSSSATADMFASARYNFILGMEDPEGIPVENTDEIEGMITFLDGLATPGLTISFEVVLSYDQFWDGTDETNKRIKGYASTKPNVKVYNIEPTVIDLEMNNLSAEQYAGGNNGHFSNKLPMGQTQKFKAIVEDPGEYDLTNTTNPFQVRWTAMLSDGTIYDDPVILYGDPEDNLFEYAFPAAGEWLVKAEVKDKDMKRWSADTYTVHLTVVVPSFTSEVNGVTWIYELCDVEKARIVGTDTTLTGNVTIPSELDGNVVVALAESALKNAQGVTGIVIPKSVVQIEDGAFAGLEEVLAQWYKSLAELVDGGASYGLGEDVADKTVASITVSDDATLGDFVLAKDKVYDSVVHIVNTADREIRIILPEGYSYRVLKGSRPLTVPAHSECVLTITRLSAQIFLVTVAELEVLQ